MRKPIAVLICVGLASPAAADWPWFRGPHGSGVSTDKGLPTKWSAGDAAWKARLAGQGVSSPIVTGDRVFVTSQSGRGVLRPGGHPTLARGEDAKAEKPLAAEAGDGPDQKVAFFVEAFHRKDGRRLWQHRLEPKGALPEVHQKHNLATPSPVTDGTLVYAWFGTGQLVALDAATGKLAWQKHLGQDSPFDLAWGHASSPALHQDLVILLVDHKSAAYLLALDKRSGEVRWKTERPKGTASYSTPTIVKGPAGDEMVVNSTQRVDVYDPRTGTLLWWVGSEHNFAVPVPAHADGVLYLSRGYRSGPYMAVAMGGRGDIAKTHVKWSIPTGAPYCSSLTYYDGLLYMANDVGVVTAVDPATGEKVWQERVDGIFSASPIGADGKLYLQSETGDTIVLAAGRQPKLLSRNPVGERSIANPAISKGQIFIRTDGSLLCFGKQS
jgi:outer membrane protein assembly factor BamB